ncbi:MAG TPA: AraC family transcriptional regulator [Candidatus Kapabacteria bacterium]|nr:AraC family transcriptional regulator [Candidatus Kapabacteria bacterium]
MGASGRQDLELELRELDLLIEKAKREGETIPTFLSDEDHPIFQRLRRAVGEHEALPEHVSMIVNAASRALERVESAFQKLPHQDPEARSDVYSRLLQAKSYIEDNFSKDIDVSRMAQKAAMSSFHFLRLFKVAFDQTPYQYLLTYRLKRSSDLLITTELPIYEIAYRCGFDSNIVFSTQFKQVFGMPPSRWRMMGGRRIN